MQAIDHDERRRKIAEIAVEVIANEGLEAATVRRIAAAAGYSTTIITHYFNDKNELLLLAYQHISSEAAARLSAIREEDPCDLLAAMLSMTALEEASRIGWRVYIAFWERAGRDPAFAREQREGMEFGLAQLAIFIRNRIGDHPRIDQMARHLIALVHGIAIQQLFNPGSWSREELEQTFALEIESLLKIS